MAKITLTINGNIDDVQRKIATIKSDLKSLEQFRIKVSVDSSGIEALDKSILKNIDSFAKLTNAQAKLTKAQADLLNAQTRAAESTAKLAKSQEAAAQSAQKAASAQSNVAESMALTIRNAGNLAASVNQAAQAYDRLAQAQGRIGAGVVYPSQGQLPAHGALTTTAFAGGGVGASSRNIIYDVPWEDVTEGVNTAAQAAQNAGGAFGTLRENAATAWRTLQQGGAITNALGDSLGNIILKMGAWQVLGALVAKPIAAFREALETMREVDKQLTNIQKVSGMTAAEIDKIGDAAYSTASKYGVAAEDYLSAVYEFQKAGLGDSAEQLGELAIKTQLVGDTTADVASKFLVSANAAWELSGSFETLNKLVDEADYINNNYATTLPKIAEGLPIVASVAAQAGMSMEQVIAMLGTITSVTQETGTKAATAARALILNILGAVGEYEDGIEVTKESVESLNDVLNIYAADAMKAAEAAGTVINPMEAIAALAKASEDGLLNQAELFDMLSGLGGKLRTNQLTALVTNLDMVNQMLADMGQAAGTADAEISTMLTSWESKTQILQNTWTEFISHLVDTTVVKGGIDLLTGLVKVLDSGVGKFAALTIGVYAAGKALAALSTTGAVTFLLDLVRGATAANVAFGQLWILMSSNPLFWAAAAAAAIYGVVKAADALTVTYEEQLEVVESLNAEYERQFGMGSEYAELKARAEDLTEAERQRLLVLEGQNEALAIQLAVVEKLAAEKWQDEFGSGKRVRTGDAYYDESGAYHTGWTTQDVLTLEVAREAIYGIGDAFEQGRLTQEGYRRSLAEVIAEHKDYYDGLKSAKAAGIELSDEQVEFIRLYEMAASAVGRLTTATDANTGAQQENAEAVKSTQAETDKLADRVSAAGAAVKDFAAYGELGTKSYSTLKETLPEVTEALFDETGALTEAGQAAFATAADIDDNRSAMEYLQREAERFTLQNTINALGDEGVAWDENTAKIQENLNARIAALHADQTALMAEGRASGLSIMDVRGSEQFKAIDEQLSAYKKAYDSVAAYHAQWSEWKPRETGGSGGGASSSKTEKDAELEALKDAVALEKQRLSFMEAANASTEDRIAKLRDIQDVLHAQAEYMRSIGADEADVLTLSTEWHTLQSKIAELEKKHLDDLKAAVTLRKSELSLLEAQDAPAEEILRKKLEIAEALRDQLAYMEQINAEETDRLSVLTEIAKIVKEAEDAAKDAFYDLVDDLGDALDALAEQTVAPLQEELDLLEAQRDAMKEQTDEQKKLLAVEEARIALENAQRQRTVRQWNAAAGQWEWVANAKTVEDAKKSLADAEKELAEFRRDQEISALEKQIKVIREQTEKQKKAWEDAAKAVKNGSMSVEDGLAAVKGSLNTGVAWIDSGMSSLQSALNTGAASVSAAIAALLAALQVQQQAQKQQGGTVYMGTGGGGTGDTGTYIHTAQKPDGTYYTITYTNGQPVSSTAAIEAGDLVYSANGDTSWSVSGTRAGEMNASIGSGGGSSSGSGSSGSGGGSSGSGGTDAAIREIARRNDVDLGVAKDMYNTNQRLGYDKYDAGGLLRGRGQIKDTREDEMVLPPDLTRAVVRPALDGTTARALDRLRVMYGMKPAQSTTLVHGGVSTDSGTHIGTQYVVNGMTISPEQAKYLTVEQAMRFLRGANNLPLHYNS